MLNNYLQIKQECQSNRCCVDFFLALVEIYLSIKYLNVGHGHPAISFLSVSARLLDMAVMKLSPNVQPVNES